LVDRETSERSTSDDSDILPNIKVEYVEKFDAADQQTGHKHSLIIKVEKNEGFSEDFAADLN